MINLKEIKKSENDKRQKCDSDLKSQMKKIVIKGISGMGTSKKRTK
jgi:hypothetical protein